MFRHILIPTDGSTLARKAIVNGVKFARSTGAKVTGFFAAPPYRPLVYEDFVPANFMSPKQHEEANARLAAKHLAAIERACKKAGVSYQGLHFASEFPSQAIIAAAKSKKPPAMGSGDRRAQ